LKSYTYTVRQVDASGNTSQPSNQAVGYTHRQGLNYKYYHGTNWNNLPNFNSLTPQKQGITDTVNATDVRTRADNYGMLWQGYIYIPVSGTYTFYTNSDDGSKLYINTAYTNGATALVNNDGAHGTQLRSGNITLTEGYHSIAVTYFEKTGGELMEVQWSCAAAGIEQERIPKGVFSYQNASMLGEPNAPTNLSAVAASYKQINLIWSDNSNNETGFEIVRSATANGTYLPIGTVNAGVNSFSDSGLNASTTYHYRVRSINAGGPSALTGSANATTQAAPPAPAIPTGLAATAEGTDRIHLNFNDNSSDETAFELWRSVGNQNNFRLVATLPKGNGGLQSYTDTALFANVTYYYRVRATGLGVTIE
jgi:large repetitive protein